MKLLKPLFSIIFLFLFMNAISQPLWMRYPSISPDGKEIVFSYKGYLYRVSSQGGTAIPITIHKAYDYLPVWSPDGKWFLVSFHPNHWVIGEVGLISSNGTGEVVNLTNSGYSNELPKWTMEENKKPGF